MDVNWLHDLRLPLQLIQSGAQLARIALDDPAMNPSEYLEMVSENVSQLKAMLDGAMMKTNAPRRVDVGACMRGLCLRCQGYAAERGVVLHYAQSADAIEIFGDETLLSRAALNLLMNALRFTPSGGRVEARCAALGDFVELTIRDGGPGIPTERMPYIFLRGETDGGAGYGLPSTLDCAAALGGTLSVKNCPTGGSVFTLRLPVDVGVGAQVMTESG